MGIITVDKVNHLYWLGRYAERVFTTLKEFFVGYDMLLDNKEKDYQNFCQRVNIPDVYGSNETFLEKYPFDTEDGNSILSNLIRAYDNAVVMRDEIGTDTLSYIQLAIYDMKKSMVSRAPLIELQHVIDNLYAFWGCLDDRIDEQEIRNIIKSGRRVERLDLYLRFEMPVDCLQKEMKRLMERLNKVKFQYNEDAVDKLLISLMQKDINYSEAIYRVEQIYF